MDIASLLSRVIRMSPATRACGMKSSWLCRSVLVFRGRTVLPYDSGCSEAGHRPYPHSAGPSQRRRPAPGRAARTPSPSDRWAAVGAAALSLARHHAEWTTFIPDELWQVAEASDYDECPSPGVGEEHSCRAG